METFLRLIVLLLLTFLVSGKFFDPANLHNEAASNDYENYPDEASGAERTDDPDALLTLYAVAGVTGIIVVVLLCLGIYRIYQKRQNHQKDSVVLMENGKKPPEKQVTGTDQRTSCQLVREKEADGRVTFKKKKSKAGKHVRSVRESRNPEEPAEQTRLLANITLASHWNPSHWNGVLDISKNRDDQEVMENYGRATVHSYKELKAGARENEEKEKERKLSKSRDKFDTKYETLKAIGEGAFGFVKLAQRRSDFEQVVVKFIIKSKISSWTLNNKYGRVPMEVGILARLHHPNIVKVIDVFENNEFVNMVMEKHGSGMDLFEFIDRKTCLDEPLGSYIFRQAVDAVSYLHFMHVIHRDIKEENIIIDEHFHINLIDFGAATYFGKGQKFATFCGTFQYCSPEVVLGNMYEGPEQDIWALGVALYGLMFGAFPFCDREDIIDCKWNEPSAVTRSLSYLLTSLLTPDPKSRAKISDLEHNSWVKQYVNISNYRWCDVVPQ